VREASEPRDVIWENLGRSSFTQIVKQRLNSLGYLCGVNIGFAFLIWAVKYATQSVILTTVVIAIINSYAPTLVQQTVDNIEVCPTDNIEVCPTDNIESSLTPAPLHRCTPPHPTVSGA
jgi:hypothetical protein